MPYILPERRKEFDQELAKIGARIKNKGELNYCVSILMLWYKSIHGENYQSLSDAKNALTDAVEEFVENHLKPYERRKKEENGELQLYLDYEVLDEDNGYPD
jgi:hypothetical protein